MTSRGRFAGGLCLLLGAVLALSACSTPGESATPSPEESVVSSPAEAPTSQPEVSDGPDAEEGAEEAFLAWLQASRLPDTETACAALSPELVERMIAELDEAGVMHVDTCDEMISTTADLYELAGDSADVDVDVRSESQTDATLFVTYTDSGDCGTVVMHRPGSEWIITEQSRECAE